jgi:hypothetical protein
LALVDLQAARLTDVLHLAGEYTSAVPMTNGLGSLRSTPGSNTHPLYGCLAGASQFLSGDAGCERQSVLGVEGWAYNSAPGPNSNPLYRCLAGSDHFVSTDPGCEHQNAEGGLGWTVSPGVGVF